MTSVGTLDTVRFIRRACLSAELLLATLNADDDRRTDVDEILKAAGRAAGLTRQLLAFSRKQVLQPTLLDLNSLVVSTTKMLRRLIGEHIELVTRLAPAPSAVHADAGQLEQILMNLAVNARDAMPQGGRLSIETATVVLDVAYALYGIVKQSGGHVWVDSEAGRGSTFKVYLPRAEEGVIVERPTIDAEAAPTGSETVLLVEDEQAVRILCRVLLERAGYQVFDAADPRQAEDLFRQHADRIDLLVTDVIMPGSSGPSLFARLSVERPLRVLYMSGYADNAIVQPGERPSDIMFLQKPFTADGLLCKVREALDQNACRAETNASH